MKRVLFILGLLLFCVSYSYAQKYACVNTEYLMRNVPDFAQAQNRLNKYAEEYQKELEAKIQEIDKLKESYQQESYLLPENLKQRRQDDIVNKEKEVRELQQQRFGAGGDLDQKRSELMKPVQNRVYSAIERVAREKNFAFVFDKAGAATLLYVSEKYDISDQVLEAMGVKLTGANPADDSSQKSDTKSNTSKSIK